MGSVLTLCALMDDVWVGIQGFEYLFVFPACLKVLKVLYSDDTYSIKPG
jgi:hypothetical protein